MPVSDVEPGNALSQDMPCVRCGYNLCGLTTDKLCPECGTPIDRSTHGNLLKFADTAWLEQLRRGTTVRLWSIIFGILMIVALSFLSPVASTGPTEILGLIGGALGLWATFLITTQEPRISLQEDTVTLRTVIRFCAIVSLVAGYVQSTVVASSGGSTVGLAVRELPLAGLVALIGELLYLRRSALRIVNLKLARSTRVVMWGLPASLVAVRLGAWAMNALLWSNYQRALAGQPAGWSNALGLGIFCVAAVAFLVFVVWFVGLLCLYRRAFTKAVAESRRLSVDDAAVAHGHG